MSIPATEAVTRRACIPGTATATTDTKAQEDKEMFLELMVAQLRYQDPMNPPTPASSSPSRRSSPPWRRCRTSPTDR